MLEKKLELIFSVECKEKDGIITSKIICDTQYDIMEYAYYLCRDNDEVLKKQMYIKDNTFKFDINRDGNYYVKGYVKYKNKEEDNFIKVSKKSNIISKFDKLYIIITVDTENITGSNFNFIECDFGDEVNCGIRYVMRELEKRDMRGVFFTNVYEHLNYSNSNDMYIENLIENISDSGHEIGLHTHQNNNLDFYKKNIISMSYEEQYKVLEYGTKFIKKHTSKTPISFRGGAYSINDNTFKILSELGYKIESSSFYHHTGTNNRFQYFNSLNQVTKIEDLLEFPIISTINNNGLIRKFDINTLNENELINIVNDMKKRNNFNVAQLMFHSFSFLDQIGGEGKELKYQAGTHEVYGVSKSLMKRYEKFLDYLYEDPDIKVVTFQEYLNLNLPISSMFGDGVFITGTQKSKESKKKVQLTRRNHRCSNVNNKYTNFIPCNFGDYEIPNPSFYFENNKIISVADNIIRGELMVIPSIEPLKYSLSIIDWNIQFSRIPNTFQLYLQSLNPIQFLTRAYILTEDSDYLKFAYEFLLSWLKFADDIILNQNNRYLWNDHAVSLRCENIMFFGTVCSNIGVWTKEFQDLLSSILTTHGEWLYSDEKYAVNHNHGVMQDKALLYVGYLMSNSFWVAKAKNRLQKQLEFAFNEEFVHRENSPEYAIHANMFNIIGKFLIKYGDDFGEDILKIMNKSKEYTSWTIKPNGIIAQIGDTKNIIGKLYADNNRICNPNSDLSKIYPKAGYYFYRSQYDSELKNDTWKMFKSGYYTTTHKHADDGSFMLYSKGYEIFVDCGMYGYVKDDFKEYFVSAKAHNSVVVNNKSYLANNENKDKVGFLDYKLNKEYDIISAFNSAYEDVNVIRSFYSVDDLTIIYDKFESKNENIYSQLFHLSEYMEIIKYTDNEVTIKIADSNYIARIKQLKDNCTINVIVGELNTPDYGLISRCENHIDTITTLKFDKQCDNGEFITCITIEDTQGNVRLSKEFENISNLKFDESSDTFKLGNLNINL